MRLPAVAAAVLTLFWLPAAVLAGPAGKVATGPKPKGLLTVTAIVALGPIAGPPKPVSGRLVRMLDAESRRAGLALLNYEGAKGDYRLQGDVNAVQEGGIVTVVYSWQVFDRTGAVAGGTSGSIPVQGNVSALWSEVNDPALKAIAEQGIAAVMRKVNPDKPEPARTVATVPPPAAGAAPGRSDKPEPRSTVASISPPAASAAPVEISRLAPQPVPPEYKTDIDTGEALRLVNAYRKSKGLRPLRLDGSLSAAASALARDMAGHDRLSHIGPDEADLRKRLQAAGYNYKLAAENVGVGQLSLAELIAQWKRDLSQSRTLLLPEARAMGIAYQYRADTNSRTYWTLVVAAPL